MRKVKRKRKIIKLTLMMILAGILFLMGLIWYIWDYKKKYDLKISMDKSFIDIYVDDEKIAMYGKDVTLVRQQWGSHTIRLYKEIDEFSFYEFEEAFYMPRTFLSLSFELKKHLTPLGQKKEDLIDQKSLKKKATSHEKDLFEKEKKAQARKKNKLSQEYKKRKQRTMKAEKIKNWNTFVAKATTNMFVDKKNKVVWENFLTKQRKKLTFFQAKAFCKELVIDKVSGWTVANKRELRYAKTHKNEIRVKERSYWTAEGIGSGRNFAFAVDMLSRKTLRKTSNTRLEVKCVHRF